MKLVILLGLSFSFALSMEQPVPAVFENYKLVGDDGKVVTFPGNLVRELLPGLAEKFKSWSTEGKTGAITIPNLNQSGLHVLKRLLGPIYDLQQQYVEALKKLEEKIPIALKETEDSYARRAREFLFFAQDGQRILEKIPSIGDHFLPIFNDLILWRVAPILGKAAGIFAAKHLDFGNDADFAQLKQLDPQAQLIYFYEAPITIDNVYRAYEWLKELIQTPAIIIEKNNHPFLDQISDKITDFAIAHIAEILRKYPNFETLIKSLMFEKDSLRMYQAFLRNPQIAFEKVIMTLPNDSDDAALVNLGENRVGVLSKDILHIFNAKTYQPERMIAAEEYFATKNVPKLIGYCAFGKNKIVAYSRNQLVIFDLTSGHEPVTIMLPGDPIKEIQSLDDHQLLVRHVTYYTTYIDVFDVITQKFINNFPIDGFEQMIVLDSENVVIVNRGGLLLRDVKNGKGKMGWGLEEGIRPPSLNRINAFECVVSREIMWRGMTGDRNNIFLSVLNVKNKTLAPLGVVDIGSVNEGAQKILALDRNFFITTSNGNLWYIPGQNRIAFIGQPLRDSMLLDKNYVAVILKNSPQVIIKFVPQTSTLAEILAEIKKNTASQAKQAQSPQVQKRPAVQEPALFIPAAAQGARPEVPEVKKPRSEKEEKSQ